MIPALAWLATGAEVTLGIALVLGVFTRTTAFLSGFLLLLSALALAIALGVKRPARRFRLFGFRGCTSSGNRRKISIQR